MGQSKTVKINLKQLIANLIFAFADKNQENVERIKNDFELIYNNESVSMKGNIIQYLLSNKIVQDNEKLLNYFNTFSN